MFFLSSNAGILLGVGAGVGLLQWMALQAEAETPRSGWWVPASAVGLALPLALYRLVWSEPVDPAWLVAASGDIILSWRYAFTLEQASKLLLAALVGGALAGVFQQRILRRSLPHAWWWVPASAVGWGLGLLGRAAGYGASTVPVSFGLQDVLSKLLSALLPGLLLGAVTGGALVWLRRLPASAPAARLASPRPWFWRLPLLIAGLVAGLVLVFFLVPILQFTLTTPAQVQYRASLDAMYGCGVAFSPDGARLATTLPDQGGVLIDLTTGRTLLTLPAAFGAKEGAMTDVAFGPDGALLATSDAAWEGFPFMWLSPPSAPTVRLWDAATGAVVRVFPERGEEATRVVFSPNGALLASASSVGPWANWATTVKLLDVASGTEVRTLPDPPGDVTDLAFSPDGRLLAATSSDGTVKLWDVATGAQRRSIEAAARANAEGQQAFGSGAFFSPDGTLLAVARGKTVELRDVATGAALRTLTGHQDQVSRAAFSPDGTLLATASDDKTVRLWDVATGALLHTLEGHGWWVRGVTFSPDGKLLASASFDGTVKLWDVATGAELGSISWPGGP
jgi:WD40 repeat protein